VLLIIADDTNKIREIIWKKWKDSTFHNSHIVTDRMDKTWEDHTDDGGI